MFRLMVGVIGFVAVVDSIPGVAVAAELSQGQRTILVDLDRRLDESSAHYLAAAKATGFSPERLPPSQIAMVRVRISQARSSLDGVGLALARMPSDHPDVAARRNRLKKIFADCKALEQRLDDLPTVPKVRATLDEVDGLVKQLDAWVKQLDATKDKSTLSVFDSHRQIDRLNGARARLKASGEMLDKLPALTPGVSDQADRRRELAATVERRAEPIEAAHAYLLKIANPDNYPTLRRDIELIEGLGETYNDSLVITQEPELAAVLITQALSAHAEFERFAKTYGPLSRQGTTWAHAVERAAEKFVKSFDRFTEAAADRKKNLPRLIAEDLKRATYYADAAIRDGKPQHFTSGARWSLKGAREKLTVFAAFDPEAAKELATKLAAVDADVARKREGVRDAVVAVNRPLLDQYKGGDRRTIEAAAIAAWKKREPNARVLAVRIPPRDWTRRAVLRLSDRTWTRTDTSQMRVHLIVQVDAAQAVDRPIVVTRDHLRNDQLTGEPVDSPDLKPADLPAYRFYLLKNVK